MNITKRFYLSSLIVFSILIFDQATKTLAHINLPRFQKISFMEDTLRLQYAENAGAAFSLGANLPETWRWIIFGIGQGIFLLLLGYYLIKNRNQHAIQFYGFVLILGGGLGNFLDRLYRNGVVVDFLNVGFGSIRTAIFNVADIAITCGLLLLIWSMMQHPSKHEDHKIGFDSVEDELPVEIESKSSNPL
ncbi:MAG: signal peptidase II [Deferribacteres bacterium]|nr:signal peptidase II [candidate division KSB1 bacterium]MCB9502467.1 signal peptidase II [Deferribacteres bacterium]